MSKSASVLAALLALVLAASAAAVRIPRVPDLPPGWSHAEINIVVRHQPHTLTYDRGRVEAVTSSSVTLREPDGSVQTIPVSPTAVITIDGRRGPLSQIRPREIAVTVGIDGAPAVSVKVVVPPAVRKQMARGVLPPPPGPQP